MLAAASVVCLGCLAPVSGSLRTVIHPVVHHQQSSSQGCLSDASDVDSELRRIAGSRDSNPTNNKAITPLIEPPCDRSSSTKARTRAMVALSTPPRNLPRATSVATVQFASASVDHMEGVLYKLHSQICWFVLRNTTSRIRSWVEQILLCVAIASFGALIVSHLAFCHRLNPVSATAAASSQQSQTRLPPPSLVPVNLPTVCLASIPGFSPDADVTHLALLPANEQSFAAPLLNEKTHGSINNGANTTIPDIYFTYSQVKGYLLLPPDLQRKHKLSVQVVAISKNDPHCFGEPLLQFIIWRWSLIYWGTADTVMMNWFLGLDHPKGYLFNPRTNLVHDLEHQNSGHRELPASVVSRIRAETTDEQVCRPLHVDDDLKDGHQDDNNDYESCDRTQDGHILSEDKIFGRYFLLSSVLLSKFSVVLKTSFLFFITTTLVSFTLRETQQRMLAFTLALREHVRSRQPLTLLIIRHIIENLVFCPIMVGIMFFLIEFYRGDKFLAFMVLSLVWVREVFSVISLRSQQSMHFFPRIFFLLFCLFHIYLFSYPFGFSYTALATTVCTMLHSMLFFWHRYELPAIANGFVSPERPRMFLRMNAPAVEVQRPYGNSIHTREETPYRRRQPEPTVPLQEPYGPQRSFPSMSSLGNNMSRQTSSNGLFNPGEDGDESYMYFMDGEVVMHRTGRSYQRRGSSPSGSRSSLGSQNYSQGRGDEADSSQHQRVPNRIIAHSSFSPSTEEDGSLGDDDNDDDLGQSSHNVANNSSRDEENEPRETSGLQAIMESMQNTPLHGNLSSAASAPPSELIQELEQTLIRTAPSFPTLE